MTCLVMVKSDFKKNKNNNKPTEAPVSPISVNKTGNTHDLSNSNAEGFNQSLVEIHRQITEEVFVVDS